MSGLGAALADEVSGVIVRAFVLGMIFGILCTLGVQGCSKYRLHIERAGAPAQEQAP